MHAYYIDAWSLMYRGYNNIVHFLCECVLLRKEPHRPWEDLPGQRSLYSVSPDVCLQLHVSPVSAALLPWQLALVPI